LRWFEKLPSVTLKQSNFDVQLIGGMVHALAGYFQKLRTGRRKTLVATLPAYLNALTGQGCHIVTVNALSFGGETRFWMDKFILLSDFPVASFNSNEGIPYIYDPIIQEA